MITWPLSERNGLLDTVRNGPFSIASGRNGRSSIVSVRNGTFQKSNYRNFIAIPEYIAIISRFIEI